MRDEEGHIYAPVRALMAPGGTPNPTTLFYQSTRLDGKNIRMDKPKAAAQAQTKFPVQTFDGETVSWKSQPDDAGNAWEVTANGKRMTWREDELFELEGTLLGTGAQWYLPGRDWGTFYTAQLYSVHGVCEGHKVKGVLSLDQVYLAEGGAVHYKKDLVVNNNMHVIWWNFATVYKDGSYDVGSSRSRCSSMRTASSARPSAT